MYHRIIHERQNSLMNSAGRRSAQLIGLSQENQLIFGNENICSQLG